GRPMHTDVELTQTGAFLGTPAYMAPEQMKEGKVDARSDLYSFAVVAYEALTGERVVQQSDFPAILLDVTGHVPAPVSSPVAAAAAARGGGGGGSGVGGCSRQAARGAAGLGRGLGRLVRGGARSDAGERPRLAHRGARPPGRARRRPGRPGESGYGRGRRPHRR